MSTNALLAVSIIFVTWENVERFDNEFLIYIISGEYLSPLVSVLLIFFFFNLADSEDNRNINYMLRAQFEQSVCYSLLFHPIMSDKEMHETGRGITFEVLSNLPDRVLSF